MRKNKIGTVFLVSILCLSGIGVSYAGFMDVINVYGTITTGTVDIFVEGYSGTWVFKIYDFEVPYPVPLGIPVLCNFDEEILIYQEDEIYDYPGEAAVVQWAIDNNGVAELISWAAGRAWDSDVDPPQDDGSPYDAVVEFFNIFPCINFHADLDLHYIGTIPAKFTKVDFNFVGEDTLLPNGNIGDWLKYLRSTGDFSYSVGSSPLPAQLHYCDHVYFNVNLHLPQDNLFQGLSGTGYLTIELIQWNDPCDETTEDKIEGFSLPTIPVTAVMHSPWIQTFPPGPSTFRTTLSMVPVDDYNVWDGDWVGWCVDQDNPIIQDTPYTVLLYSSYDPACPWPDPEWPIVNWIINNKELWPDFTWEQMQNAIYHFIDGGPYTGDDPVTLQIIADADGHYEFIPEAGDWVAVLCWPIDPSTGEEINVQKSFIEVDP